MADIEVLPPYTEDEKAAAYELLARADVLVDRVGAHIAGIETNFAMLGKVLHDIEEGRSWMIVGFSTFRTYLASLEPRAKKRTSTLYNCIRVARTLLPIITEPELEEIGITKANTLRRMVEEGKTPSATLIDRAKRVTNEELEAIIGDGNNTEEERGKWMSLGGAYYTEEERQEFLHVVNVTLRTDPPINCGPIKKLSDLPPQAKKEVFWRWLASFGVEHEAEQREQSGLS